MPTTQSTASSSSSRSPSTWTSRPYASRRSRRRTSTGSTPERGPPLPRGAGSHARDAARGHGMLEEHGVELKGKRSGRDRPQRDRREADGDDAPRRARDGHDLPLADRGSRLSRAARRRPRCGGRSARPRHGGHGQAGGSRVDVGVNAHGERDRRRRGSSPSIDVAGLMTPVPGGVGPMTIAMLLANTLKAARHRRLGLAVPGA